MAPARRQYTASEACFPGHFEPVNLPPQSMPAAGASAFFSAILGYLRVAFVVIPGLMRSIGSMRPMELEHMALDQGWQLVEVEKL